MDEGTWRRMDSAAIKPRERVQLGASLEQSKTNVTVTASTAPSLVVSKHDAFPPAKHCSILFCLVMSEVM